MLIPFPAPAKDQAEWINPDAIASVSPAGPNSCKIHFVAARPSILIARSADKVATTINDLCLAALNINYS